MMSMSGRTSIIDITSSGEPGIVEIADAPAALRAAALKRLKALRESARYVDDDVVVFAAPRGTVEALGPLAQHAGQLAARHEALVEALTPPLEVPPPAVLLNARANAELRARVVREGELLSSAQVAELSGSKAANRAALAARWRKSGRVFAVPLGATLHYPAFQFDADGRPRPVLADVVRLFAEHRVSPWSLAAWFLTEHPRLRRRPADLVAGEPERVLEAARQTFEIPF
jgi:hypothetical protein